MLPSEPAAGRCYGLGKDHKSFDRVPPFRPIISGCGSNTEAISHFVDFHANHLVKNIDSYVQDTPDLLRHLAQFDDTYVPDHVVPVCIDVINLYSNIPHDEGIGAFKASLDNRANQTVSTGFLIALLTLVLTMNVFEFDLKHFLQEWGTAMGTKVAPTYANLFMASLETFIFADGAEHVKHIYKQFYTLIEKTLTHWHHN